MDTRNAAPRHANATDTASNGKAPVATFEELDQSLQAAVGHKLFTILAIDWSRSVHMRCYSSQPLAYPCGGAKPLVPNSDFHRTVVMQGQIRICADAAACRAAFFDYDLIQALGCESAVNIPVRDGDQTIGSLNLLHVSHWYEPAMLAPLRDHARQAKPLLLQHFSTLTSGLRPL